MREGDSPQPRDHESPGAAAPAGGPDGASSQSEGPQWRITHSAEPEEPVSDVTPAGPVGDQSVGQEQQAPVDDNPRRPLLTFLTDFGLAWGPVGICHAVMKDIAPQVEIIDISHDIPAFDIRAGAWVLASALQYTPVCVHVAVVDPGVGTQRLPVALRCERGDLLVGPDNGLLLPAAERLGGVVEARQITNQDLMRHPVSTTFHGRDIFAPTGAHLAIGVPLSEVGPALEAGRLVEAPWRRPEYGERRVTGEAVLLDSFGNVRTNLESDSWPLTVGAWLRARTSAGECQAPVVRTFGEVGRGELLVYEDSSGYVCLAMNLGSAGRALSIEPGMLLEMEWL